MFKEIIIACIILMSKLTDSLSVQKNVQLNVVSREEWKARKPTAIQYLSLPVPIVVIHHSAIPPACCNLEECCEAMRFMQDFHMDDRGWADIGYNFAVGSDGRIYEGRGWSHVGAHTLSYNFVSIGICLIGNWNDQLPPKEQLESAKRIIEFGLVSSYVDPEYILIGHRQARDTQCPGNDLFAEIGHWSHFTSTLHTPDYYNKTVNINKL